MNFEQMNIYKVYEIAKQIKNNLIGNWDVKIKCDNNTIMFSKENIKCSSRWDGEELVCKTNSNTVGRWETDCIKDVIYYLDFATSVTEARDNDWPCMIVS